MADIRRHNLLLEEDHEDCERGVREPFFQVVIPVRLQYRRAYLIDVFLCLISVLRYTNSQFLTDEGSRGLNSFEWFNNLPIWTAFRVPGPK